MVGQCISEDLDGAESICILELLNPELFTRTANIEDLHIEALSAAVSAYNSHAFCVASDNGLDVFTGSLPLPSLPASP